MTSGGVASSDTLRTPVLLLNPFLVTIPHDNMMMLRATVHLVTTPHPLEMMFALGDGCKILLGILGEILASAGSPGVEKIGKIANGNTHGEKPGTAGAALDGTGAAAMATAATPRHQVGMGIGFLGLRVHRQRQQQQGPQGSLLRSLGKIGFYE